MASANDNDEEVNPYLAMREAKIARNQTRLRELGLLKPPPSPVVATRSNRGKEIHKGKGLVTYAPPRRSTRLSSQPKPARKVAFVPMRRMIRNNLPLVSRKRPLSPVMALSSDDTTITSSIAKRAPSAKAPSSTPAANSVRSIDLDVKTLVLGKDNDGLLGKMMEHTGKEFVINESFSLAAPMEDQQRLESTKLSFNKYCGVQDWKNAMFLWVNLGNADTPNEFLEGATQVTWFGGSRMHDESPVVLKLVKYGKEATTKQEEGGSNNTIVLWCRRYQPEEKKYTPYVCFGRMGYRSHVPGSQPLSFVWDLLDYDGLKHHNDPAVRETFDVFTR